MKRRIPRSGPAPAGRPRTRSEGAGGGAAAAGGRVSAEATGERERLQYVATQLKTLYHMGRDLGEDENWSDALDRFLMALVSFLGAEGAALLLFSDRERSLSARARFHVDDALLDPAIVTIRDAWHQHARGAEIHPLESYVSARKTSCLERAEPWRVTLIPLRHRGRALGFLLLDKHYAGAGSFEDDYHFLSALQTIFAEEIANASYISELRQLSRFNNKVLDNIRSGVVTTDLDGNIRYVNALAGQMCPRLRRAGMQPVVHFDELFRPPVDAIALFRRFLESGEDADVLEVDCHAGPDAVFPARLRLTRMHDDLLNGTVVVGIFDDLSEHKRMEEAIRRNDRLRSLGQLSASVAHEIRNPLAGIATTAEVLGEKLRGDESNTRYIRTMLDEISRLDRIVRDLLAFARPPRPQLAPCDPRDVIARVHELVSEQASAKRVALLDGDIEKERACHADPAQLTQVLLNLALNAVQACGNGDRVTMDARAVRDEGMDWIEFNVADTGPGVPEGVRGSLFEPFVTTKTQGTGLGLAICRQIVGDHRGSIACEFLPRGTRFVVRVPAMKESTTAGRPTPPRGQ